MYALINVCSHSTACSAFCSICTDGTACTDCVEGYFIDADNGNTCTGEYIKNDISLNGMNSKHICKQHICTTLGSLGISAY